MCESLCSALAQAAFWVATITDSYLHLASCCWAVLFTHCCQVDFGSRGGIQVLKIKPTQCEAWMLFCINCNSGVSETFGI